MTTKIMIVPGGRLEDTWIPLAEQWLTGDGYVITEDPEAAYAILVANANLEWDCAHVEKRHRWKTIVFDPCGFKYDPGRELFKAGFADVTAKPHDRADFLREVHEFLADVAKIRLSRRLG